MVSACLSASSLDEESVGTSDILWQDGDLFAPGA